jgi:VCBS repeat-containing protein
MTTYQALLNKIKSFATAHQQIKRFGSDFTEQFDNFVNEGDSFPVLYVSSVDSLSQLNQITYTLEITCADLILEDRANVNVILNDCKLILNDLFIYYNSGNDNSVHIEVEPTLTPLNNYSVDNLAGARMTVTFEVDTYGLCAIPIGEIEPTPSPDCEDANYTVRYESGTVIESGVIASGGSKTIQVPDCPAPEPCDPVTYNITRDGEPFASGSEPSGGSININVPSDCPAPEPCADGTVNVQQSDATLISAVTVASGGTAPYQVADSVVNVNAVKLADVKATDTLNISVVDSTDTAVSVTLSGGNKITIPSLPCASSPAYDGALPLPTGDSTDLSATNYRGASWFVLSNNNPFGNTNRFTDDLGTQIYTSGVAIDWQSFDRDNSKVLGWFLTPETGTHATIIGGEPFTKASLSGWYMPTIQELFTLLYFGNTTVGHWLNYAPFNYVASSNATRIKTRTEEPSDTLDTMCYLQNDIISPIVKTQNNSTFLRRIYTLAELGL